MKINIAYSSLTQVFHVSTILALASLTAFADGPARLPVKEITVFKDGHAFVAEEGSAPTDASGNVLLDNLPTPVIGTFWPYAAEPKARLTSVVAEQHRVSIERTALSIPELLQANPGAEVYITENNDVHYAATIMGVPQRSSGELATTSAPGSSESLPEIGNIILLQTGDGMKAVPIDHIKDITFKQKGKLSGAKEEFRNSMSLKLDWGGNPRPAIANVGMFYLQKGIRWIPEYEVTLDGKGNAAVKLQATLVNEMMDLEDVSVNLVVGVPTFTFKGAIDPMALQQTAAQLSQFFQNNQPNGSPNGLLAANFSNAMMSQQQIYRAPESRGAADESSASGDSRLTDANRNEDLYVFNAGHVTLKKGGRMVLPLAEFTIPYKDVFTLELPISPPIEMRQSMNGQSPELLRLLNSPKVMHKVRFTNSSRYPLTTAPALVLRDGRILAQGMMTYTAIGTTSDLAITTAVDISAAKSDLETKRVANALMQNEAHYTQVNLAGKITIKNHRAQPAELEVTRYVLGALDSADHDGKLEKINAAEDAEETFARPDWWYGYGWPYWWTTVNGVGRATWNLKLDPGQTVDLNYTWNYFWR